MGFDETSPHTQYDMDLLLKSWFYMYIAFFGSQTLLKENHKNRQIAIKDDIEATGNPLFSTTIALPPTAETDSIPTASTSRTQRTRTQGQSSPTVTSKKPVIEIYTAYTHEDNRYFSKLKRQLDIMGRQDLPISCHEDEIIRSTNWQRRDHLETANLILLLLSDTFLDSDFCYCDRLLDAVERHNYNSNRYCIIPIIVRPLANSLLEGTPFRMLDFLPSNGKAISRCRNSDSVYAEIAEYITKKIRRMILYLI